MKREREDGRRWPAVTGGRSWPEKAAKAPNPNQLWGASVVKSEKLEFWKWCFGERLVGPLERARRGEEDGVVGGGQDGVGGGGDGGGVLEVMGCFGWKWRKEMVMKMVLWLLLLLEWRSGGNGGGEVGGGGDGERWPAKEGTVAVGLLSFAGRRRKEIKLKKERKEGV